jgi:hypothetical protein
MNVGSLHTFRGAVPFINAGPVVRPSPGSLKSHSTNFVTGGVWALRIFGMIPLRVVRLSKNHLLGAVLSHVGFALVVLADDGKVNLFVDRGPAS